MIGKLFLVPLLLWMAYQPRVVESCHFTKILYENGTWCCPGAKERDTNETVTLPSIATETPGPPTTHKPIIPTGDCVCGLGPDLEIENRIDSSSHSSARISNGDNARAEKMIRPWLVRLTITKDSLDKIECTGSLLNRRWVITAAHCFCGTIQPCPKDQEGFDKIFTDKMDRVEMMFGTPATDSDVRGPFSAAQVYVHPDYFQGEHRRAQPVDVALVEVEQDLTLQDIKDPTLPITGLVPICIPPPSGISPDKITTSATTESSAGNETQKSNETQKTDNTFEDMDCWLYNTVSALLPNMKHDFDPNQGYLACHPKAFTDPFAVNVMSSTSFITAYGDTARDSGPYGYPGLRYLCRTNAYGPKDSFFHDCFGKCNKDVETKFTVGGESVMVQNPSLADPVCKKFVDKVAKTGKMKQDFKKAINHVSIPGIDPSKVEIIDDDDNLHSCYPFDNFQEAKNIQSGFEYPFRHGWCSVCEMKGVNDSLQCSSLVREDANWGWCLPECDEDYKQPEQHEYPHEVAVDAFVYENCSHGINTFKEFCTGAKFATAYTLRYTSSGDDFFFVDGVPKHFNPGDPDWTRNHSIIRPGARYQGSQHTQVSGDVCFGDAGGSVWKIWAFRDPASDTNDRPDHGKLAVLTGVISRFEHHCGFYRPDVHEPWSRPVQHSIHARITTIRDWILSIIRQSGSCKPQDSGESRFFEGDWPYY